MTKDGVIFRSIGFACTSLIGTLATSQAAAMPSQMWRDAEHLIIHCMVLPRAAALLGQDACRHVMTEASRGAPLPVVIHNETNIAVSRGAILIDVRAETPTDAGSVVLVEMRVRPAVEKGENDMSVSFRQIDTTLIGSEGPEAMRLASAALFDRLLPWRTSARHPGDGRIRRIQ